MSVKKPSPGSSATTPVAFFSALLLFCVQLGLPLIGVSTSFVLGTICWLLIFLCCIVLIWTWPPSSALAPPVRIGVICFVIVALSTWTVPSLLKVYEAEHHKTVPSHEATGVPKPEPTMRTEGAASPIVTGSHNAITYGTAPAAQEDVQNDRDTRRKGAALKTGLVLFLLPSFCLPQTTTRGICSPIVTGSNNQFTFHCDGLTPEQGKQMLEILNQISRDRLNPRFVMKTLDQIKALAARGSVSSDEIAKGVQKGMDAIAKEQEQQRNDPKVITKELYQQLERFLDTRRRALGTQNEQLQMFRSRFPSRPSTPS